MSASIPLLGRVFHKKDKKRSTNTNVNFTFLKHLLLLAYYSIIYTGFNIEESKENFTESIEERDILFDGILENEEEHYQENYEKQYDNHSTNLEGKENLLQNDSLDDEKMQNKYRSMTGSVSVNGSELKIKSSNNIKSKSKWEARKSKLMNVLRSVLNIIFLLLNLAIIILQTNISVQLSLSLGALSGALVKGFENHFSMDSFKETFVTFLYTSLWVTLSSMLKTLQQALLEQMMISWRWVLASNLHHQYFKNNKYFWSREILSNPDQRIQADTDAYTLNWMKILENAISAPLNIIVFTYSVCQSAGWQAALTVYLYFIVGIIISKIIIGHVAKKWDLQKELEGDFRYKHAHLRASAESVAMLNGGQCEKENCNKILNKLSINRIKLALLDIPLNFHMNNFGYLGGVMNYAIVGICAYFFGKFREGDVADFSTVMRVVSYQLLEIIFGFTVIVQVGNYFSELTGVTGRLGIFLDSMKDAEKLRLKLDQKEDEYFANHPSHKFELEIKEDEFLFNNFTLNDPIGNVLINNIEMLTIKPGMHTLITGESGTGKSTLIRTVCNLWPHFSGFIHKPKSSKMYIMPQNPYCSIGSITDLITYPFSKDNLKFNDHELKIIMTRCLEKAKLEYILDREDFNWDTKIDWPRILSGGEQQRLAFSRFFFRMEIKGEDSVSWLIMDEATSSLDINSEETILKCVLNNYKNLTLLSVGHRPTLRKFHTHELILGLGIHKSETKFEEIQI